MVAQKPCHLTPEVLFRKEWKKKMEREMANSSSPGK